MNSAGIVKEGSLRDTPSPFLLFIFRFAHGNVIGSFE